MIRTAILLLALAGCASTPKSDGPPPLPVDIVDNEDVSDRRLKFAARRELDSYEKNGRRLADLADAAYSMELELRRRGYSRSAVTFRFEPNDEAPEKIEFVVSEGPLGRIGRITFPGATVLDDEQLRNFFPSGAHPRFQQSQVDGAVGEIERAFLLLGYRDVRAGPLQVNWNDEGTNADIVLPIAAGDKYVIDDYTVEGDLDPDLERRIIAALLGQGYYLRLPAEAAAQVRADLLNRGHQKATVTVTTELKETRATLHFRVYEGPVYRVRDIVIEGHDRTRVRLMRSRITAKMGEPVSDAKLNEGVDGLYRTGVFKRVTVQKEFVNDRETDITYVVEEIQARTVDFEAGWGSYELLRGGVRYQDRNFLGYGRLLDVQAGASTKGYELLGIITDSYLLGQDNLLRLAGGVFQRQEPSFKRLGYRINLSVTHRFDSPWTVTGGYIYDTQKASDIDSILPDDTEGELVTSAGLFAAAVYDSRDSALLPSTGTVAEARIGWSSPLLGADLDFISLKLHAFRFWTIRKDFVLGIGARFDSSPILNNDRTLPIQNRLFLGGATTIRSFDQSELGPTDPITDQPLGGLTAFSFYSELRMRLWRELHGAAFYEVGMVSPFALSIEGPPGHSIGCGLRYYLPVGPIRIDFAYTPGELFSATQRWQLHFAFGFSF